MVTKTLFYQFGICVGMDVRTELFCRAHVRMCVRMCGSIKKNVCRVRFVRSTGVRGFMLIKFRYVAWVHVRSVSCIVKQNIVPDVYRTCNSFESPVL